MDVAQCFSLEFLVRQVRLTTLLKTQEKNKWENVNKDCRYLVVFLISGHKNFYFAISMFQLNFYQIAYIAISLQFFSHYTAFFSP